MRRFLAVLSLAAFLSGTAGIASAQCGYGGAAGALLGLRVLSGKKEEPKPAAKSDVKPATKKAPAKSK